MVRRWSVCICICTSYRCMCRVYGMSTIYGMQVDRTLQDSRLFTNMNYHYVTRLPASPASLGEFVFTAFRRLPSVRHLTLFQQVTARRNITPTLSKYPRVLLHGRLEGPCSTCVHSPELHLMLLTRTSVEALIQAELTNALRHAKRVNVACLDEAVKERVLRPRSL